MPGTLDTILEKAEEVIALNQLEQTPTLKTDQSMNHWYRTTQLQFHPDKLGRLNPTPTQEQAERIKLAFQATNEIKAREDARLERLKHIQKENALAGHAREAFDLLEEQSRILRHLADEMFQSSNEDIRHLQNFIGPFRQMMEDCMQEIVGNPEPENVIAALLKLEDKIKTDLKDVPAFNVASQFKEAITSFFTKLSILITKITNPAKAQQMEQDFESTQDLKSSKNAVTSLFSKEKKQARREKEDDHPAPSDSGSTRKKGRKK